MNTEETKEQLPPLNKLPEKPTEEKNPFLKTVASLIHKGRNRRTFIRPR